MKHKMRLSCSKGYEWPNGFLGHTEVLYSLDEKIDFNLFDDIIYSYDKGEDVIVTLLSKEYMEVGILWISMLKRIDVKQYIIIALDDETEKFLNYQKIPNCRIFLHEFSDIIKYYKSREGFTEKGLAVIALKYPIVKLVLDKGYNVLLMDIDALLLKRPSKNQFGNVDIAFQRVVYFPDPIARIWGFAACSGFVRFRSNQNTIKIIKNAIDLQRIIYCDQTALNVALWESDIHWRHNSINSSSFVECKLTERKDVFASNCEKIYDGYGSNLPITIRALSPDIFWRNDIVPLDISQVIIFHPNSPKEGQGKINVFKRFGICK